MTVSKIALGMRVELAICRENCEVEGGQAAHTKENSSQNSSCIVGSSEKAAAGRE